MMLLWTHTSSLSQFDQELEKIIRELILRIAPRRLSEFDGVWKTANGVCDRYEMTPKTGDFFPSYL